MWWKVKKWEQSWKYCRRRYIRKRQFHRTFIAIDSNFVQIIKSCFKVICQIQSTEAFEICFRFLDVMWFDDRCNIVGTLWWLVLETFTHNRIALMSNYRRGTGLSTFMILSAFDVLQLRDAVNICTNSKFYTYIFCLYAVLGLLSSYSCSNYTEYIKFTRAQQLLRWTTVWPQQTWADRNFGVLSFTNVSNCINHTLVPATIYARILNFVHSIKTQKGTEICKKNDHLSLAIPFRVHCWLYWPHDKYAHYKYHNYQNSLIPKTQMVSKFKRGTGLACFTCCRKRCTIFKVL